MSFESHNVFSFFWTVKGKRRVCGKEKCGGAAHSDRALCQSGTGLLSFKSQAMNNNPKQNQNPFSAQKTKTLGYTRTSVQLLVFYMNTVSTVLHCFTVGAD